MHTTDTVRGNLLTPSLVAMLGALSCLAGCNAHPLKDAEMEHWTGIDLDDAGTEDGADDAASGDGDDAAADGDGDGGTGAGDDDDGDVPTTCESQQYTPDAIRPAVMLVLDQSGSMSETWMTGGGEVSRWSSLHGVVSDLLHAQLDTMTLGVTLFPAGEGHPGCEVLDAPVVPLADDHEATHVLAQIPAADAETEGRTPMRRGVEVARDALYAVDEGRPRAMILVTDGVANCADPGDLSAYDDGVEATVRQAHEDLGISTYVVGIGISDEVDDGAGIVPSEEIARVATAGGVAYSDAQPYYAADDEEALAEALAEIGDRVACTIQLAAPVAMDDTFEVTVGGEILEEVSDCGTETGWRFTDGETRTAIELCGDACGSLELEGRVETETCGHDLGYAPVPTSVPVP